jgi:hypothetical protein
MDLTSCCAAGRPAACLSERFAPRAWFRAVHGPDSAASRLAAFLGQVAARDGQGPGAGGIARPALRALGEPAPPAQV